MKTLNAMEMPSDWAIREAADFLGWIGPDESEKPVLWALELNRADYAHLLAIGFALDRGFAAGQKAARAASPAPPGGEG